MQIQLGTINGEASEDGDDGSNGKDGIVVIVNETVISYICSSELEINNALEAIGGGNGIITIIDNNLLTNTIIIDGGGSYVIQGQGIDPTIEFDNNKPVFSIINATSCTIRELKIYVSDVSSSSIGAIYINEMNDNLVYIEKVQLIGEKGSSDGTGIIIRSNNTWIRDCYISIFDRGIYQNTIEGNAHICNNIIYECADYGMGIYGKNNYISGNNLECMNNYGIYCGASYNIIIDNLLYRCGEAIFVAGGNSTIGNNIIDMSPVRISIFGDYNVISGNQISSMFNYEYAIYISGSFNIISGNQISNIVDEDFVGIGIGGSFNTISGNQISKVLRKGITLGTGDYNVISGNCIFYSGDGYYTLSNITGISIAGDSDYNTINGNGCFGFQNTYYLYYGHGIYIATANCNNNSIVGNTCQSNDIPYRDYGTDTFEDGNNFLP